MSDQRWLDVDAFITDSLVREDGGLAAALDDAAAAGLPAINVAPNQGKLLHLLALVSGARRVLEIGTLAGYSTIWLARALPEGGRLTTLEYDERHAAVARANLARAGVADRVDVVVGAALDTLPTLQPQAPYDFVFIDADKVNNPAYFEWALRLSHRGSVIVVDNVVRSGSVLDQDGDAAVQGTRALFEAVRREPRVSATAIQTVGVKGYDGFLLAVVTGEVSG